MPIRRLAWMGAALWLLAGAWLPNAPAAFADSSIAQEASASLIALPPADGPATPVASASVIAQLPVGVPMLPPATVSSLIEVPALDATSSAEPAASASSEPMATPSAALATPRPRATPAPTPTPVPTRSLVLLHTNDSYGLLDPIKLDPYSAQPTSVGGLTRLAAQLATERSHASCSLLVSAGNMLGPGSLAASTRGKAIIGVMNRLGYDVWMPANHDFSYGLDALMDRIAESSSSVVLTNVRWKDGDRPLAPPYVVLERGGLRVAFLGLVDPSVSSSIDFGEIDRLAITPPLEAAARWVPYIRREATPDLVVALTHLSLDQEMPLLTRSSGVDVVIGGFNSAQPAAIAVHEVVGVDGKRALHAGGYGAALGRVRLNFAPTAHGFRFAGIDSALVRLDEKSWPKSSAEKAAPGYGELLNQIKLDSAAEWNEDFGDLARLSAGLDTEGVLALVPAILRQEAGSEVAVIPRSFFHNERVYGPITSVRSLYWAMPWEDALCVTMVGGDTLAACYQATTPGDRPRAFFAGVTQGPEGLLVNGHPLDGKTRYAVAMSLPSAQGRHAGFERFRGCDTTTLPISVRRAVVRYFREGAQLGSEVSSASFPDYSQLPFWKATLQLGTDLQSRAVTAQGTRYPDLSWRTDKAGMSWGGDLAYRAEALWGPHDLTQTVNLSYHSDTLASGESQVSNDQVQYIGDYRGDGFTSLVRPFSTLTLSTHFVTPTGATPYFLGQLGAGFSHELPFGLEFREGLEYRHHFLDPGQADKTGATLGVSFQQTWWLVRVDSQLKVFATPHLDTDGVTVDSQNVFSLPLSDATALTYRVDFFRNTRYEDWATRGLIGIGMKFNQPWIYAPASGLSDPGGTRRASAR